MLEHVNKHVYARGCIHVFYSLVVELGEDRYPNVVWSVARVMAKGTEGSTCGDDEWQCMAIQTKAR